MGPRTLVVKKGEHGVLMFSDDGSFAAPAFPLEEVFDPTGAGDTFAGGFIGYLAGAGDSREDTLRRAVVMGSTLASFCVEDFSLDRLLRLTRAEIDERFRRFRSHDLRDDLNPSRGVLRRTPLRPPAPLAGVNPASSAARCRRQRRPGMKSHCASARRMRPPAPLAGVNPASSAARCRCQRRPGMKSYCASARRMSTRSARRSESGELRSPLPLPTPTWYEEPPLGAEKKPARRTATAAARPAPASCSRW